jgi:hypothetical protein
MKLKSFDFVVYAGADKPNLLVDVKGRKVTGRAGQTRASFQTWVTRDDVRCLSRWSELFGEGFTACFLWLYWCDSQPPDALFHEVFCFGDRWYAVLATTLGDYQQHMRDRSAKWDTVSVRAADFGRIATPLASLL